MKQSSFMLINTEFPQYDETNKNSDFKIKFDVVEKEIIIN